MSERRQDLRELSMVMACCSRIIDSGRLHDHLAIWLIGKKLVAKVNSNWMGRCQVLTKVEKFISGAGSRDQPSQISAE